MKSIKISLCALFLCSNIPTIAAPAENTPLYQAVKAASAYFNKSYLAEIDRLIAEKVNLNAQNEENKTALHCAVERKNIAVVKKLIAAGAYLQVQAFYGWTPLHWAVYVQSPEIVQLFIDAQADLNFENNYGYNALALAIYYNNIRPSSQYCTMARMLINAGAYPSVPYKFFSSKYYDYRNDYNKYIYEAVAQRDIEMLKILLELNVSANYRVDLSGKSEHDITIVHTYKTDKKTGDVDGMTPLHKAVATDQYEIVQLLLQAGAVKTYKDCSGALPIDYAKNPKMKLLLS